MSKQNGPQPSIVDLARRYATLDARKQALKDELDEVERELSEIEPTLLEAFAEQRLHPKLTLKLDDGTARTLYVRRDIWVRAAEDSEQALFAALRRNNLGHFVKEGVNVLTLSGWYREQAKLGEEVPSDILASVAVSDKYSVRTRKAKADGP